MEKKLEDMNQLEIKALLYDQIILSERTKVNIQVLQNRLEELIKQDQEGTK